MRTSILKYAVTQIKMYFLSSSSSSLYASSSKENIISTKIVQMWWLLLSRCVRNDADAARIFCESNGVNMLLTILCDHHRRSGRFRTIRYESEQNEEANRTLGMVTFMLSCLFAEKNMTSASMDLFWKGDDAMPVLALIRLMKHSESRIRKHALLCLQGLQFGPKAATRFAEHNIVYRLAMMGRRQKKMQQNVEDETQIRFSVAARALQAFITNRLRTDLEAFEAALSSLSSSSSSSPSEEEEEKKKKDEDEKDKEKMMIMKEKERKEDKDKKKDEREEKNERELARMTRKSRIVRQITMSKCLRDDKDQIRREVLVRSGALDEIICELMFERESRTSSLEFLRELRTVAENISNRLVVVHDNDENLVRFDHDNDGVDDRNADVIFSVDGDEFLAHSTIVSRSEYMNRIMLQNKKQKNVDESGVIVVKISRDVVTYRAFKAIMSYIYTQNVHMALSLGNMPRASIDFLIEVWAAARTFQMTEISQHALKILRKRINPESASLILNASLGVKPPLWKLGSESFGYIVKNASTMLRIKRNFLSSSSSLENARSIVRYLNRIMIMNVGDEDSSSSITLVGGCRRRRRSSSSSSSSGGGSSSSNSSIKYS